MILADRGGSSGAVGQRWADLSAAEVSAFAGTSAPVPGLDGTPFVIERIARLDDSPGIALAASKRGLQNPDLLFIGYCDGRAAIQAADAKFSVETARSKQVSPSVVEALLELGDVMKPVVGALPEDPVLLPGVFLSPDYPLTAHMLRGRQGIVKATVTASEVRLLPAPASTFFDDLPGKTLMPILADVDALPIRTDASLLAGLYYFRLARSIIGAWTDAVRPLLALKDQVQVDELRIRDETERRAAIASSAWDLVQAWDADVEAIRRQRAAVEQVAGLPAMAKDLRGWIESTTRTIGGEPPSMNQVRRRLGAWFRGELRAHFGPMTPPVDDFGDQLVALGRVAASLAPRVELEARRIVAELLTQETISTDEA